jgi:hypothetical protein
MKTNGKCPKCDSKKTIRIESPGRDYNTIAVGVFSAVSVMRHLCTQCGFLEEWVESPVDIERIREYYSQ